MEQASRKKAIRAALDACRAKTLWLLDHVPDEFLKRRVHSFYSPIGWHFGHVGRTEEFWVEGESLGRPLLDDNLSFLFADLPENPKDNRVNIPDREEIAAYLQRTRRKTLESLDAADLASDDPLLADGYAWEFALQHECQHQETIAEMLALIHKAEIAEGTRPISLEAAPPHWQDGVERRFIAAPGGEFCMGSSGRHAYDNEKEPHVVRVDPFLLAEAPVTAYQWSEFVQDGGYHHPRLWSDAGWARRQAERAEMPEYWMLLDGRYAIVGSAGLRWLHPDEPAGCVCWYEAEAFCRWTNARMPTEQEWEYAASYDPDRKPRLYPWGDDEPTAKHASHALAEWEPSPAGAHLAGRSALGLLGMAGGLWEWTSSPFLPYPGFQAFPYDGYSKDHMKGEHRVCRGGSWASAAPILRCSFRNWYVPTYRQGFLGLRLAR